MLTFTVVATKGGVGKTTMTANIGGLLRDFGFRVLLVDADVQPSLSKYFDLKHEAPFGLTRLVSEGYLTADCISTVQLPFGESGLKGAQQLDPTPDMDIVLSDTREGKLQDWLGQRLDRLVRISMALNKESVAQRYDFVLIDTQGALGHLQDAAVNAADILISPVTPDMVSAREFIDGTKQMIARHEEAANLGFKVPAIKAVINRTENTRDSRVMSTLIREGYLQMRGRVSTVHTAVHSAVSFKKAATAKVPVHWIDPVRAGDAMHMLLWELIPSLQGQYAPNHRNYGCSGAVLDGFGTETPHPDVQ